MVISSKNLAFYNQAYQLQLQNSPGIRKAAASGVDVSSIMGGSVTKVPPVNRDYLSSDTLDFVKEYQKDMSGLMDAANALRNTTSSVSRAASSDNTEVADVKAGGNLARDASYALDVQQIAKAQVNTSAEINVAGAAISGGLSILTASGMQNFTAKEGAANNRDVLNDLAKQINNAKMGVTASVAEKNGKVSLSIAGDKTGESSSFAVSGSLAAATGLDQSAQAAQNAVYSVTGNNSYLGGRTVTSESNSINIDGAFKLTATLKKEGKANINVAQDTDKTAAAIEKMVGKFNDTLKLLNNNADRGIGVLKQMGRMVLPPAAEKSMNMAGISTKKDGTLVFNKSVFTEAVKRSPSLVNDVISGSSGVAQGVYHDAQQGLKQSSNSLLSEDLRKAKLSAAYDTTNFMAGYSRSGAYNMNNYYSVGLLMNTNI